MNNSIKKNKWIKGSESLRIIDADHDCIKYIESINDHNRKAAQINRPDDFFEDMSEVLPGWIAFIILAIASSI